MVGCPNLLAYTVSRRLFAGRILYLSLGPASSPHLLPAAKSYESFGVSQCIAKENEDRPYL